MRFPQNEQRLNTRSGKPSGCPPLSRRPGSPLGNATGSLIAPVIPSSGPAPRRAASELSGPKRLLLARPPPFPASPEGVVYGFGRIDASGRIADRAVTSVLGWCQGDRLTLTADAGMVVARRDPGGMITVPARPYVVIPAALRLRCGLRPGDRLLLAAVLSQDALAAYPMGVVDHAMRTQHPVPHEQGGRR